MRKKFGSIEERFWAKVEKTAGCWNWIAGKTRAGYGMFHPVHGQPVYAHRLSFELSNGPIPEGKHIDHICHNKACVNPRHLRSVTPKQNMENRAGPQANNKSCGVRGVTWSSREKKWKTRIGHNGAHYSCGTFSNLADAEAAVIAKRLELFTHNDLDRIGIPKEVFQP